MAAFLFAGQGAQFRGMGDSLFEKFRSITDEASDVLGYSIKELCLEDPLRNLNNTQYTQPALYVVNALSYYNWCDKNPTENIEYLIGHSLGEYNALLAAEVFSFEDGLKLVAKRGELMAQATGGGMAAVLGIESDKIQAILNQEELHDLEIVNFNTPEQSVLSGSAEQIAYAQRFFEQEGVRYAVLNVSGAFHSKFMKPSQDKFSQYVNTFKLNAPKISVVSNYAATPYEIDSVYDTLSKQIANPVRWMDSIIYILAQGVTDFFEEGSAVLTKMNDHIFRDFDVEKSRLKLGVLPQIAEQNIEKNMVSEEKRYFTPWQQKQITTSEL